MVKAKRAPKAAKGVPALLAELTAAVRRLEKKVENDELVLTVHRLERLVSAKLDDPVALLTLEQAAEVVGRSPRVFEKVVRRGAFTDPRGEKVRGSKRLLFADEVKAYRSDGLKGVQRLRRTLGRD